MNRRNFIKIGTLSTLPLLFNDRISASESPTKSVVWLWLGGGASQIETFCPIPDAPVEYRSTTGHVDTNIPEIQLGGDFVELAKVADKLNIVRSFGHNDADHQNATHWMMTGHTTRAAQGVPAQEPSLGSIISAMFGPNNPSTFIPTYVRTNEIYGDGAVWLGNTNGPFDVSNQENLVSRIEGQRLADRLGLLKSLDRSNLQVVGYENLVRQAADVISSNIKDTFDIFKENESTREAYGDSFPGKSLLLARRLVEAGTKFITIHYGGFDLHSSIEKGMHNLCPPLDLAIAAFIKDIYARGINKEVLLVVCGEFGRTPKINSGNAAANDYISGRDHFGQLSPLLFAGGNYSTGRLIGKCDNKAQFPTDDKCGPGDLVLTIFDHLGLDKTAQLVDNGGRPRYFIEDGARIIL